MARAICRCGQTLEIPPGEASHVVCPKCSARARIVRKPRSDAEVGVGQVAGDGFARIACPCGRKLKVSLRDQPTHGKCPECGRVVPVPSDAATFTTPEAPTAEMPAVDQARLDAWTRKHRGGAGSVTAEAPAFTAVTQSSLPHKNEAGLRVCPQCGKPIHMGADTCRTCGIVVPRR